MVLAKDKLTLQEFLALPEGDITCELALPLALATDKPNNLPPKESLGCKTPH